LRTVRETPSLVKAEGSNGVASASVVLAQPCASEWARQDSNLSPTDYESAALTAELRARYSPGYRRFTLDTAAKGVYKYVLRILSTLDRRRWIAK
jgi:hypothetical protein